VVNAVDKPGKLSAVKRTQKYHVIIIIIITIISVYFTSPPKDQRYDGGPKM